MLSARVFPARAGMDRFHNIRSRAGFRVPRTRGDGPTPIMLRFDAELCSPHARGWTARDVADHAAGAVFPARAGMDRRQDS